MATNLRRNKTMLADGTTVKFLYVILRQLDLRSIDWNIVATELGITNGHAARMRYSRLKTHMEGATTTPRVNRKKGQSTEPKKRCPDKAITKTDGEVGSKLKKPKVEVKSEQSVPPCVPAAATAVTNDPNLNNSVKIKEELEAPLPTAVKHEPMQTDVPAIAEYQMPQVKQEVIQSPQNLMPAPIPSSGMISSPMAMVPPSLHHHSFQAPMHPFTPHPSQYFAMHTAEGDNMEHEKQYVSPFQQFADPFCQYPPGLAHQMHQYTGPVVIPEVLRQPPNNSDSPAPGNINMEH